ncbi:MAG: mechanosensitive ion channel domain-containing protein [Myxococcota bacterium]
MTFDAFVERFLSIWNLSFQLREDVTVSIGAVILFVFFLSVGRLLGGRFGRWARHIAAMRQIENERALDAIASLARNACVLFCVGLSLELGHIVHIEDFIDGFFNIFNYGFFTVGKQQITLTTLLTVVVIIWGTNMASRLAIAAARQTMYLQMGSDVDEGTVRVVERLLYYAVMIVGIIIALETAGIDLSALLAAGAAFAVGLSLALQSVAQNFISGLILLFERAITPNDIVELDGRPVRVISIGIRSTVVRTLADEEQIVPNYTLVENAITNYTFTDNQLRIKVMVGVAYESDLKVVEKALHAAARQVKRAADRKPVVLLNGFGASSVDFEVSIWIEDPWQLRRAASELRMAIWWTFKENDIVIAFPQLDVHLDTEISEGLRLVNGPDS